MAKLVCVEAFSESNNKRLLLKLDLQLYHALHNGLEPGRTLKIMKFRILSPSF